MQAAAPDCFPPTCLAAVEGAEGSGALPDVLDSLAASTDEDQALGYRMRVALTYPVILAIVFLGAHLAVTRTIAFFARESPARGSGGVTGWILLEALDKEETKDKDKDKDK